MVAVSERGRLVRPRRGFAKRGTRSIIFNFRVCRDCSVLALRARTGGRAVRAPTQQLFYGIHFSKTIYCLAA